MVHPFSKTIVQLRACCLRPISLSDAKYLGAEFAKIEPWVSLSFSAAALSDYLSRQDGATRRYVVSVDDNETVGAVVIQPRWLCGPYLELLGILPSFQQQGIGGDILRWMELEVGGKTNNLWVVASAFNEKANDFYAQHGYEAIAVLDDLVRTGFDEILRRKRLD